jgi:hypothetical protein
MGGLSGYADKDALESMAEGDMVIISTSTTGAACTDFTGCWTRFTGSEEPRCSQNWQTGQAGILVGGGD